MGSCPISRSMGFIESNTEKQPVYTVKKEDSIPKLLVLEDERHRSLAGLLDLESFANRTLWDIYCPQQAYT